MLPFATRVRAGQVERFLASADDQAATEGARYASLGRVGTPVEQEHGLTTLVRGETGTYPVSFWIEAGQLASTCECPSWRDPCKHQVAAALSLWRPGAGTPAAPPARASRKALAAAAADEASAAARVAARADVMAALATERPDPEEALHRALEERRVAARKEKMRLHRDARAPFVQVESNSGFTYLVHLRGGVDGPHSCDCPDFEANRLHCCKHVERVRLSMASGGLALTPEHRRAAERPRAYLHFGEVIEPRWLGPASLISDDLRLQACFDGVGRWTGPLGDDHALRDALLGLGEHAERDAIAWLERRLARHPDFGGVDPAGLIPDTPLPLHPYQRAGVAFLARVGRALLADEMGLGKTVQAILAAAVLRRAARPVESVTIACPASLRGGWQDEIRRWLGEEATLLTGTQSEREKAIASRPRWLVTHYEQVLRDHAAHHAHPPDLLIIDEAQRAKGLQAVTARALKDIGARHVFALTGTPLENRLEEAYAIAQLIDQRLLPPLWQLERDHYVREEQGRRVIAYRGLDALRTRLASAFLRRRKEDVALDLPERVRSVLLVPLHAQASGPYEDALAAVRRLAARKKPTPADLDRIQRLLVIARRACDGPHLVGVQADLRKVPKLAELEQLLRDACLGERRKAVVFSEWTDMTAAVEEVVRRLGLPAFHLRGEIAVAARPQLIRAFAAQEGPAVFISTDAGGVGLNLQAADVVVNVDLPWNPARLEQRLARVHRIGARRTVQEVLLVTEGTIEQRMLSLHVAKREVLDNLWAAEGEDVVVAPGAGEALRAVIEDVLRAEGPRAPALPAATPRESVARFDAAGLAREIARATQGLEPAQRAAVADVLRALADALNPKEG